MSNEEKKGVAFIVGSHRSGTTMLRNIFDKHPQIATTPELYAFERLWGRRLLTSQQHLARKAGEFFKLSKESVYELSKTKDWKIFLSVLSKHTASKPKYDLLVTKTPFNIIFTDLFLGTEKNFTVIYIMRDGRDVCASAVKKWKKKGALPLSIAARWHLTARSYRKHLKNINYVQVFYEKLTSEPGAVLDQLFSSLGLTYDSSFDTNLKSTSSFDNMRKKRGIQKSSNFKAFFDKEQREIIEGLLQKELKLHGYSLEFEKHHVPLHEKTVFKIHCVKHHIFFILTRFGLRDVWRLYIKFLK